MPEECGRNPDKWAIRMLDPPALDRLGKVWWSVIQVMADSAATERTHLKCRIVHDDFVISSLYEPSTQVLELLARLDKQVSAGRRELDRDALAGVSCPDIQARIARAAVDGEEV